jgi:nitrile hydratase accessory protein
VLPCVQPPLDEEFLMNRATDSRISDMAGVEALPRRSGELVFHENWERRAFALTVSLCDSGYFDWETFRQELVETIKNPSESSVEGSCLAPGYYEHWLHALEKTLNKVAIISPKEPGRS